MIASDNMLIHGQDCLGLNPYPGHLEQAIREVSNLNSIQVQFMHQQQI